MVVQGRDDMMVPGGVGKEAQLPFRTAFLQRLYRAVEQGIGNLFIETGFDNENFHDYFCPLINGVMPVSSKS